MFLVTVAYLRLLLAGLAGGVVEDGRLLGFLWGALGVKGGLGNPTFVVFTVLTVVLHGYAAWHAYLSNERAAIRTGLDEAARE